GRRSGAHLPRADLDEFLDLARGDGLLAPDNGAVEPDAADPTAPAPPPPGVTLDSAPSLTTSAGDSAPTQALPARRGDLVIRSTGDNGQHVVKDPQTGEFFDL